MSSQSLILLELNEVNFLYVQRYIALGHFPTLAKLIERHGVTTTTSEVKYEHLEPWIQWVTIHTGLSFAQHRVFRLGDIVQADVDQIWESLERRGITVGAFSPMNARNRCQNAAFFIPDPWTPTPVTGGRIIKRLHSALAQVVSDNASARITASSVFWLLLSFARFCRLRSLPYQGLHALRARSRPWSKALFLDRLLADVFINRWKSERPQFSSLFLNGAAHIQHHYLFCSRVYDGPNRNPTWYVAPGVDPLFEVYKLYDQITADLLRMHPHLRLIIATGLHQEPCPNPVFYYRLKNHAAVLNRLGVRYLSVLPLMSRDFTIICTDRQACEAAAACLRGVKSLDGVPLFFAEARDSTVFAMFTYPLEIKSPFEIRDASGAAWDFADEVAFVALKNGIHDGTGYAIITDKQVTEADPTVPVAEIHNMVLNAFPATS